MKLKNMMIDVNGVLYAPFCRYCNVKFNDYWNDGDYLTIPIVCPICRWLFHCDTCWGIHNRTIADCRRVIKCLYSEYPAPRSSMI